VFELDLEHCPNCGGELKLIAAILEQPVIVESHPGADGFIALTERSEESPVRYAGWVTYSGA
jgi:tripartite-type tricarboxylate transporter receptor subunit TctC